MHRRARVLDLGCGRGGVVELLHNYVALAAGVDPDLFSLLQHRRPEVHRVCGLAECLPFPDGCFDLAVSSWVLEHLPRPQQVFDEVARVLRAPDPATDSAGGHLVFLTPNARHPLTWLNRLLGWMGDGQARLIRRLYGRAEVDTFPVVYRANTRARLEALGRAAGLSLVAFNTIGDPTYLAFHEMLYHAAVTVERYTPEGMKVHLVGDFINDPS